MILVSFSEIQFQVQLKDSAELLKASAEVGFHEPSPHGPHNCQGGTPPPGYVLGKHLFSGHKAVSIACLNESVTKRQVQCLTKP